MSFFDNIKNAFSKDENNKTNTKSVEQESLTSVQIFAGILDSLSIVFIETKMTDKDGSTFEFEYQGGNFATYVYNNSRFSHIVFPGIATDNVEYEDTYADLCNRLNGFLHPVKFVSAVSDGIVHLDIISTIPIAKVLPDYKEYVQSVFAEIFRSSRHACDKLKELKAELETEDTASDDEYSQLCDYRKTQLLREKELSHDTQNPFKRGRSTVEPYVTLESYLKEVFDIYLDSVAMLDIVGDDVHRIEDVAEIKKKLILSPVVNYSDDGKVEVSRMSANILVYLKSDEDDNSYGNILTIHLRVESETKDVVLVRTTAMLPPQGETAKHSVESEMRAHSMLLGVDVRTSKEKIDEFVFMQADAEDKVMSGKEEELSDAQRAIFFSPNTVIGYELYWANKYCDAKRTLDALSYFKHAYMLMEQSRHMDKGDNESWLFFHVAFLIGYCYIDLDNPEMAYFYLDVSRRGLDRVVDHEQYINCLVNRNDFRALSLLNDVIQQFEEKKEQFEGNERMIAHYHFLQRRRSYILIEMGEYGKAESILKKLLDVDDSKDFALNELSLIQKRKRE
ncbi:MAG: hypothetical protein MJZ00_06395 [Paludibacteraceae bacterium]|nr:hypothetical protein [Paludibacteraceae bacterium]